MDIYREWCYPWEDEIQKDGPYQFITTAVKASRTHNRDETYFVCLDHKYGRFIEFPMDEARYISPLAKAMSEND